MKLYLSCALWHSAEEQTRSSPQNFSVLSKRQEKDQSWCSGTDVLLSAGHWCCCTVWCNFQRIVLILQSFTSLKILTKNSHNKENLRLNNKVWKWQLKPSYAPVPEYTITHVCQTGSRAELDTPSEWVMVEPCLIHSEGWMVCTPWDMWLHSKQWAQK